MLWHKADILRCERTPLFDHLVGVTYSALMHGADYQRGYSRRCDEWFDLPQCRSLGISVSERMATFLYRCPDTGFRVQGYTRGQTSDDDDAYEAVTCIACTRVHLVNPTTGKVMGEEE